MKRFLNKFNKEKPTSEELSPGIIKMPESYLNHMMNDLENFEEFKDKLNNMIGDGLAQSVGLYPFVTLPKNFNLINPSFASNNSLIRDWQRVPELNWELINTETQKFKEAQKIEQIEMIKRAILDAHKEKNAESSNVLSDSVPKDANIEVNPYPQIFKNYKSFELFEYLLEKFGGKEIHHAECSFIFRQMHEDGKIYKNIRENDFREFLNDNYEITMDKLKTLENCDKGNKMNIYSTACDLIYK